MGIFDRVLRSGEGKKVRALASLVPDINALEPEIAALSDDALKAKTPEFRQRLANGEEMDDLLIEAFAVMREAAVANLARDAAKGIGRAVIEKELEKVFPGGLPIPKKAMPFFPKR